MRNLVRILVLLGCILPASVQAQEEIYLRNKDKAVKGNISKESSRGIQLKDGSSFGSEEVVDIYYELLPATVRIENYRPGFTAEREANDPLKEGKRKVLLEQALKNYETAVGKVAATDPRWKRHLEFKIAFIKGRQALEDGGPPGIAIGKLADFAAKNKNAWQLAPSLQMLGKLQMMQNDVKGAKATFQAMANADILDDAKNEAELQLIHISIKTGDTKEAGGMLDSLIKKLPKDSRYGGKAKVMQAEFLLKGNKADEAIQLLRQVTKDTPDRSLKAFAYNTLGVYYFEKEQTKDALWEFLWVDVVYNQDKQEHAKALYYLYQTFDKLGQPERGQEARQALLSEPAFAGSEYYQKAKKDVPKAN